MTRLLDDQRGITGLETAIVLIAFVVVASVFAFAVLTTGLLSSEKSKEAILGGLEETQSTIVLRGSVVGIKHATGTRIANLRFQVSNATAGASAVDFSGSQVVVSYIDPSQAVNFTSPDVTITWLNGSGEQLDSGERVELDLDLDLEAALTTPLSTSTEFTVEVKPSAGSVLIVNRRTPAELTPAIDLRQNPRPDDPDRALSIDSVARHVSSQRRTPPLLTT